MTRLAIFLALIAFAGCSDAARPSDRAIDARVADATERLQSTPAGQRVLASIDAHGGLEAWYALGPVRWRYAYTRLDSTGAPSGPALDTRQLVDPWAARAVHTLPDSSASFGWTGTEAWVMPGGAEIGTNARFWALTPYYFVSIPFVFADPGVRLAEAPADSVEGRPVDVIRVTFEPGTGDAPDDYYDLLLDPETDRVRAIRYVVSYGPFNPDGGHTPETLMLYDGAQTVGGVTVQQGFRSFLSESGTPKARGTVSELEAVPATNAMFARPADAEVQQEM